MRSSLVSQVADVLREDMRAGQWREHLPGENTLCDLLQVSRTTLRKALTVLRREGLVESSQGGRRRITARGARLSSRARSNTVALLCPVPMHALPPYTVFHITELRRHLQDAGYELELHVHSEFRHAHPIRSLEKLTHHTVPACWVLWFSSADVQRWFMDNKLPVLISGSCHADIHLPSLDVDYRAVCRHAAGQFLSLGHQRVALLTSRTGLAGDLASEQGFREGFAAHADSGAASVVAHHDSTLEDIRRALRSLFASAKPPTGLLVSNPRCVLTVMSHLSDAGIRIPRDVSLISRDYDTFLDDMIPSVAHYQPDHAAYAARLSRLVLKLATTGLLPSRPTRIVPGFRRGNSLGPPP